MQAVETDRIRVDDWTWRVTCANEDCHRGQHGKRCVFTSRRSDASYCSSNCRKYVHETPKRKQNAMLELRLMARRVNEIADNWKFSQEMFDEMVALQKAIKGAVSVFEVPWEQTTFTPAPSPAASAAATKAKTGRQPK